jgi:hypothetical protein
MKNNPGGPSPQIFDQLAFQLIQVVCRTQCNQRSSTNELLCTTRRPCQSLKEKIDNIDKFTSPLTQKKAATKAPMQKILRKRC